MSDILKAAKEALEGVTPGPWWFNGPPWNMVVWSGNDNRVSFMAHSNGLNDTGDIANASFIAASRGLVPALIARTEQAEAEAAALRDEVARLREALDKARAEDREPDYCYDDEWEYTQSWSEWPDLVDGFDLAKPAPIYTLYKGPTKWVARVPLDTDGDGEADDWEVQIFNSEGEARAALTAEPLGHGVTADDFGGEA